MLEDKGGIIMKKLLLLGALLVVGATSFSADTFGSAVSKSEQNVILTKTTIAQSNDVYSGEAKLNLVAEGTIVAPGNDEYMLVIRPNKSSDPNASSIAFDFADLKPGEERTVTGGFTAQILKGVTDAAPQIVDLSKNTDKFSTYFDYIGATDATVTGDGTTALSNIKLISLDTPQIEDPDDPGQMIDNVLGQLDYRMTPKFIDNFETYSGEILATVRANDIRSGSFRNMMADVVVKVDQFDPDAQ